MIILWNDYIKLLNIYINILSYILIFARRLKFYYLSDFQKCKILLLTVVAVMVFIWNVSQSLPGTEVGFLGNNWIMRTLTLSSG